MLLSSLILLLLVGNAVAVYVAYTKLSVGTEHVRREIFSYSNNSMRQIEALLAVYAEVRPERGLPRTRGWAASPDFLALLISIVHERRPSTVLECSSGLSTLVLAACMRNQGVGRVIALEHDAAYAEKTRELLSLHKLTEWAEVVDAPLVALDMDHWSGRWYDLSALNRDIMADLVVVDGPPKATGPMARYPALPALRSILSEGATIVLDDSDRPDETEAVKLWLQRVPGLESVRSAKCEKGCRVLRLATADMSGSSQDRSATSAPEDEG